MALYTTQAGDRLDTIAARHFGRVTSDAMLAIVYANPTAFDGNLLFNAGTALELPDAIDLPAPAPDAQAFRYVNPDAVAGNTPIATDHNTGKVASAQTASRWAIISRCATPLGDIWNRPAYGTLLYALLAGNLTPDNRARARAICEAALAPDAARYSTDIQVSADNGGLTIRADGQVVEVGIDNA